MNNSDVIIIGAGAAGLMCAWQAALHGRSVVVFEHTKKVGKKILMSGGGRCNFTNLDVQPENYLCANPHFVKSALKRYTQWDFLNAVVTHDIPYHERKHGELFCDRSAKDILKLLLDECANAGVTIATECDTQSILADNGFTLTTNKGQWHCESLVIATGGLSIPSMQTTPFAYEIAEQFGMGLFDRKAGLVPLRFDGKIGALFNGLSGNAIEATVSYENQYFTDNILFTHRGLSGPTILQISNYWQLGEAINVNLLPHIDAATHLHEHKASAAKSLLRTVLSQLLPKALVAALEQLWWPSYSNTPMAEFSDELINSIAHKLHHWQLYPCGTEGYKTAEVTLGGVDTKGLSSKTMESNSQKGLYFVGECMDVTGHLGGYNFQWAWSSGFAAAQYV